MEVKRIRCQECGEYLQERKDIDKASTWLVCPNSDTEAPNLHTIMIYEAIIEELW